MGSLKINILKVLSFWKGGREGVTQKECSVYAFDNVDNSWRALKPFTKFVVSCSESKDGVVYGQ